MNTNAEWLMPGVTYGKQWEISGSRTTSNGPLPANGTRGQGAAVLSVAVLLGVLSFPATSSGRSQVVRRPGGALPRPVRIADRTDAGPSGPSPVLAAARTGTQGATVVAPLSTDRALYLLKRLSGLTSEQLATALNVSRRTVHSWANGSALAEANERHLRDVLSVLQYIDRGTGRENRALLLFADLQGSSPLDALSSGRYEEVKSRIGEGQGRIAPAPITREERAAHRTLRPDVLVSSQDDSVRRAITQGRLGKVRKSRA